MARHPFLISYICDNQAGHCHMESEDHALSMEQARSYLQGLYRGEACSFRDVQVQRTHSANLGQTATPGDPIEFFPRGSAPLGEC